MTFQVPKQVFDRFHEMTDAMYDAFGVDCTLVFSEQVQEVVNTFDNVTEMKSVNAHRRSGRDFRRADRVFKEVESTQKVRMRVYWRKTDWMVNAGNIASPESEVQTRFYAKDYDSVMRCKELLIHDGTTLERQDRYVRDGDPYPVSFGKDKYYACFWKRV